MGLNVAGGGDRLMGDFSPPLYDQDEVEMWIGGQHDG